MHENYQITKKDCSIQICYSDEDQYEDITPTSVGILTPAKQGSPMVVKHHIYLPETAKEAVLLPTGSVIGRVQVVSLASMDDPEVVALLQQVEEEVDTILSEARRVREKLERHQQEVFSIVEREGDNSLQQKQTTVRHKAETGLPSHDPRGALIDYNLLGKLTARIA